MSPEYIPGNDFISRLLLEDQRVMDIIIKSLIGEHASSSLYCLGRCEWLNKSVSDVLYVPKTENLAPILIEVQHDVNEDFYFKSLCQKGKTQFRKIINCIENNIPKEKIRQHAINGEIFFMQQARKFDKKQREMMYPSFITR